MSILRFVTTLFEQLFGCSAKHLNIIVFRNVVSSVFRGLAGSVVAFEMSPVVLLCVIFCTAICAHGGASLFLFYVWQKVIVELLSSPLKLVDVWSILRYTKKLLLALLLLLLLLRRREKKWVEKMRISVSARKSQSFQPDTAPMIWDMWWEDPSVS